MELETVNAKIESTMLGIEDHGIMTFFLNMAGEGWGQGFGGYGLDSRPRGKKVVGTAFAIEAIRAILETVGVYEWEDLPGKHVRIKRDNQKIYAIGHITKNQWFNIKELAEKHFPQPK